MTTALFGNATVARPAPVMQTVLEQPTAHPIAVVQPSLTKTVTAIAVVDDNYIQNLGKTQTTAISQVSQQVLGKVKASEMEDFGSMLSGLIAKTKSLDPKALSEKGFMAKVKGMFGNVKEKFLAEFNTVEQQIDRLVAELNVQQKQQSDSIPLLETMYTANFQEHQSLEAVIEEAKAVHAARSAELALVDVSGFDAMQMQAHNDNLAAMMRLDKKIHDLTVIMRLAEQTAPEIRQIQDNARMLVDKFDNIKNLTLPVWKKQFGLAILNMRQAKAAEIVSAADDATNAALERNAQMLKQNSVAIAKANQRSVVDVETLENVNNTLVSMLEEVHSVTTDAVAKRRDAEKRMVESNARLLETMKKTGKV